MSRLALFALLLLGAGAVTALALAFVPPPPGGIDAPRLVHLVALLAFLGAGILLAVRSRPGLVLRHALIWLAVFALLVAGYAIFARKALPIPSGPGEVVRLAQGRLAS
ncbi:MAG: hypothetical protein H6923_10415 [Alphaproteobacteria bacterium]|nr:hypothetical protein [Alphaproteobacteria bacterium]